MMTIPTKEPLQAFAGDTWQWNRTNLVSLYPATAWDLKYYFDSRSPAAQFTITATADGDTYSVVLVPATTAALVVSDRERGQSGYYWVARVEHQSDGRVFTVGQGHFNLTLDLASQTAGGYDPRNWAEKALESLEAALQNRASIDQLMTIIAGTQIQHMTPEQMQSWYGWFRSEVRSKATRGVRKSVRVELSRGYR